jgi:hypothetical protein
MHKVNAQTFKLALFADYLTFDAHIFRIERGDYMRFGHPAFSHASPPNPIYRLVQLLHNAGVRALGVKLKIAGEAVFFVAAAPS